MAGIFPTKLVNFEVYGNTSSVVTPGSSATLNIASAAFLGVANITLPDVQFQSENLEGSGIWGQIDIPLPLVGPMMISVQFFSLTQDAISLFNPVQSAQIDIRGVFSSLNTASYATGPTPMRVIAQVLPKSLNFAQWVPAAKTDVTLQLNVMTMTVQLNFVEVFSSGPANGVLRINGVDILAPYRSAVTS